MESVLYFLAMAGLFFLMMRFGCGAHVMGHGGRRGNASSQNHKADTGSPAPQSATDPVCGMTVATATAKPSLFQGAAYYFCSPICRDKFEASPSDYVKAIPATSHPKERGHGSQCR